MFTIGMNGDKSRVLFESGRERESKNKEVMFHASRLSDLVISSIVACAILIPGKENRRESSEINSKIGFISSGFLYLD